MADDVSIKFTADISSLQDGMRQATSVMQATTNNLRSGAEQINSTFASISQAYASNSARNTATVQTLSDTELAIARQNEQAQYDIDLNGVKERSSLIRQQAQAAQITHGEELSSLLSLERQREGIELQHLQFLRSTYQQGTVAYAEAQRQIDELASQSALRRLEIERSVTQQIYSDYRRSFEQIGSSVSSSIMRMISGHMKLRDAARNIVTQILQSFIQARIKIVADWLAGLVTQTAMTQAAQTAQTAAVTAGVAARTSAQQAGNMASIATIIPSVLKSIMASAGETFAGIFGFLAPVMGPAAAGPAAAGEATVLSVGAGMASFATGAWELPSDMIAQVHQGEMIIPAGPAAAIRNGSSSLGGAGGQAVNVHVTHAPVINAIDGDSIRQFYKNSEKILMRQLNDAVRRGAHLGLSKL
jgi:hypothetical protein